MMAQSLNRLFILQQNCQPFQGSRLVWNCSNIPHSPNRLFLPFIVKGMNGWKCSPAEVYCVAEWDCSNMHLQNVIGLPLTRFSEHCCCDLPTLFVTETFKRKHDMCPWHVHVGLCLIDSDSANYSFCPHPIRPLNHTSTLPICAHSPSHGLAHVTLTHSKISNLCDHNPPTLQTDRQTDRQTDGQTSCNLNTALCT